jgi:hypothetical protein
MRTRVHMTPDEIESLLAAARASGRECRVEIADGLAIELRALRDSHR